MKPTTSTKQPDLFGEAAVVASAGVPEPLSEGAYVLRGFALDASDALLQAMEAVERVAPFRHLVTPGGFRMSVAILGHALTIARRSLGPAEFGILQQLVSRTTDMAFRLEQLVREFFDRLAEFVASQREQEPPTTYAWQARIVPSTRTMQGWDAVEIAWDGAGETLRLLLGSLSEIHQAASSMYAAGADALEDAISDLSTGFHRLSEAEQQISIMITKPSPDQVYWVEVRPSGNGLSLNAAPLRVGPLIEKVLWHEKASVILTSATLTKHGEFHYIRNTWCG